MSNVNYLYNPIEESLIIYSAKELITHLLCPICRGLVREPILSCKKCLIYGCGICMNKWKQYGSKRCLNGCENAEFGKISNPILSTILDFIMIKCPNTQNKDQEKCREILTYKNYQDHLDKCEYKIVKCMYSSCQKKMIRRLIHEHEIACKRKNPLIYFIFRDQEKSPIKIEIALEMDDSIESMLDIVSKRINIKSSNIELVMIKNHEIVEYVKNKQIKIQYIATHEGFLFGFQRYLEEEKTPELSVKGILHVEYMLILDKIKFKKDQFTNDEDNIRTPSYTRVLHFSQYTSFKAIHIALYSQFKPYFKYFVQKMVNPPLVFQQIDFKDYSNDKLHKEYESFVQAQQNSIIDKPYELCLIDNLDLELPYNNQYFHDYYQLDKDNETQFVFGLILATYIDVNEMKLNRCLEVNWKIEQKQQQ